jgi:serine/threonine-protein kinase
MSPAASMVRNLSGRRLGRYEVLAQLASGGMATVYVARARGVAGFERLVAIKVLHPHLAHDDEFISMFLDEARLAARIRHPNVVPTLDISDSQGDGYFLVMEYVEGDHFGSLLREAARAGTNVPPNVALRVVVDALEGLGAAHALAGADGQPLGIVHRDISPHNILVGADGIARITDFGVAKAEVRLSSTRDGQFKGKLAYMAPEQASSGFADQRSDLFGMGVVLWESLVGRRLFKAENNGELLHRLLYAEIPRPSDYDPALTPLDAVLAKALARDAQARFQSASEFVDAIEDAASALGGVGNQRAVGRAVKERLGAKIQGEAFRIQAAMDSLGRSELPVASIPRPEPSGMLEVLEPTPTGQARRSGASQSQPSQVRRAAPEDLTVGAKPSSVAPQEPAPSRVKLPLALAFGALVLVAFAGAAWFFARPAGLATTAPAAAAPSIAAIPAAPVPPPPPPLPTTRSEPVQAALPVTSSAPAREERGGSRRHRPDHAATSAGATMAAEPPAAETETRATTTMTAPAPEEDEVIPSPYQ